MVTAKSSEQVAISTPTPEAFASGLAMFVPVDDDATSQNVEQSAGSASGEAVSNKTSCSPKTVPQSPALTPACTKRSNDNSPAPVPRCALRATWSAPPPILVSPKRSPRHIAYSPDITIVGSPKDVEHRRARAASCASTPRHRQASHLAPYQCCERKANASQMQRSPPRSPQDTKILYDSALHKASAETAMVADEIIARQSEILARKHDIAIWQRKIHAAEKIIASLQDQVDVLLVDAREKKDTEKELACQRNAMMSNDFISEKEWTALTAVLGSHEVEKRCLHA